LLFLGKAFPRKETCGVRIDAAVALGVYAR
jgi:hypothetical protein